MAYKINELINKSVDVIVKHKLFFIEDVVSFLPCDKTTFYKHKLHENNAIKEALEKNKVEIKVSLRSKWYNSDNATTQIALYKLIATEEENSRINSQKTELEHSFKESALKIGFENDSNEE